MERRSTNESGHWRPNNWLFDSLVQSNVFTWLAGERSQSYSRESTARKRNGVCFLWNSRLSSSSLHAMTYNLSTYKCRRHFLSHCCDFISIGWNLSSPLCWMYLFSVRKLWRKCQSVDDMRKIATRRKMRREVKVSWGEISTRVFFIIDCVLFSMRKLKQRKWVINSQLRSAALHKEV